MQLEQAFHKNSIIKENYSSDNQYISFGDKIRTNNSLDEDNIYLIGSNVKKDQLSFSLNDNRRYFLENNKNRSNNIESSQNLFIEPEAIKIFKTTIPISSSINEKIIASTKKEELESSNKKEIKRKRKIKVINQKILKKKRKKIHLGSDDDNVLRKIQVNYLSFIINFSNDLIKALTEEKVPFFKQLDYKIKKIVKHKYVEDLKNKTIGEILKIDITPKIKNSEKSANKYIYHCVLKAIPEIDKFFKMNYLSFFKEYYYNTNDIFKFNGKIIPLSEKTKEKTFNYFKNNYHSIIEEIKYVCINYYFNPYKRIKKPKFKTQLINQII